MLYGPTEGYDRFGAFANITWNWKYHAKCVGFSSGSKYAWNLLREDAETDRVNPGSHRTGWEALTSLSREMRKDLGKAMRKSRLYTVSVVVKIDADFWCCRRGHWWREILQ
jgi:hypothetical protein